MGSRMPAFMSSTASLPKATQNPWTPISDKTCAIGIAPCPYAFALITAITSAAPTIFLMAR